MPHAIKILFILSLVILSFIWTGCSSYGSACLTVMDICFSVFEEPLVAESGICDEEIFLFDLLIHDDAAMGTEFEEIEGQGSMANFQKREMTKR